jgi:ABC-type multidrug transport system ATPase subunit
MPRSLVSRFFATKKIGIKNRLVNKMATEAKSVCEGRGASGVPAVSPPNAGGRREVIAVRSLAKGYGKVPVLQGLSLTVGQGELYALMGPNGSGKTTLNSILASVRAQDGGEALVMGRKPGEAKREVAYLPQDNFSIGSLTGRENLMYFAGLLGYPKGEAKALVAGILAKLGLEAVADRRVSTYSGGMRKKLELGTALFPCTRVMLLDEPTTGLDPGARRSFLGLLRGLTEGGMAVLLTTHIGADAECADRVGLISNGKIVAEGPPGELKEKSGVETVVHVQTAVENSRVASAIAAFDGGQLMASESGYRISVDNPEEVLPAMIRKLDSMGVRLVHIGASMPTLEDVFFRLTDRSVSGGDAQ